MPWDAMTHFRQPTASSLGKEWLEVHNDPLIGVTRADQLVPDFFPDDFPHPGIFSH